MDQRTLQVYEAAAAVLAATYRAVSPGRLHQLITTYFHTGGASADIGCGSGRDAAWLAAGGYPAVGWDASEGMLSEARRAFPSLRFAHAALPDLEPVPSEAYDNVLCNAALMHVSREDLITAVLNLARILRPGGRLLVSVRGSRTESEREADGRLFTELPPGKLALLMESAGLQVIYREQMPDTTRPEVSWWVLVAERNPESASSGLERVQRVLMHDKKDATYKLALLRALCAISRTQSHLARWGDGRVLVPLGPIAVHWLRYYWPFVTHQTFVAQKRGERPSGVRIAFRGDIAALATRYTSGGLVALLDDMDEQPEQFFPVLRKIADTVRVGPVQYAGTVGPRLFRHHPGPSRGGLEERFGWVEVPEAVWLDISRFDHWIEDSLILRWAHLTAEMNPESTARDFIPLLLDDGVTQRSTSEIRKILAEDSEPLECVWSGARLGANYDVDHVIPYSVWGNNDGWNMLPSDGRLNKVKSDSLPSRGLLVARREAIIGYWQRYVRRIPLRFGRQMGRALGVSVGHTGWERTAFAGLQEAVERVAVTRGLRRWDPTVPAVPVHAAAASLQESGSPTSSRERV